MFLNATLGIIDFKLQYFMIHKDFSLSISLSLQGHYLFTALWGSKSKTVILILAYYTVKSRQNQGSNFEKSRGICQKDSHFQKTFRLLCLTTGS